MASFNYKAKDALGDTKTGVIEAPSRNSATSQLRERGWTVVGVESANLTAANQPKALIRFGVKSVHVETSLQQLSLMLRSGMTLLSSLQSLITQATSTAMAETWLEVSQRVQSGHPLSDAMSTKRCFPDFVVRLVGVGENTGNLEAVLTRASTTMREKRTAREEFWSATIYPILILLLSIFVTAYMVIYLIPKLEVYLQSLGKQMPVMTQNLMDGSAWLRDNIASIAIIVLAIGVFCTIVYSSKDGRKFIDFALLKTPIFGRLLRLSETASFARTLSMMLRSGITLTDALGTSKNLVRNRHLAGIVENARERIIQGSNLIEALDEKNGFTPMLRQMVSVGQQAGELETVLSEVAQLHDSQAKIIIKRLNSMFTPAVTFVIGGVVGYVYVAFFVALFAAGA